MRLPAVAEVMGLAPEAVPERVKEVGKPLRVPVVDDNVDTAESLAMLLRMYGHDVEVAHTGPKALRLAQEHRPDVILLDIGLPGMDGNRVAQHLRQQEELGKVRLIATTGYGADSDRQHCHDAGFDYHLVKTDLSQGGCLRRQDHPALQPPEVRRRPSRRGGSSAGR